MRLRCSGGSSGCSRRTRQTQAESTSGSGKKQLAGILNQSLRLVVQLHQQREHAVIRRARLGQEPLGHLELAA